MRRATGAKELRITTWALTAGLLALLTFAPACDFINDLLGRGGESAPDGGAAAQADAAVPQPPVVPPTGVPDAAAVAAAMQNLPPGVDPAALPPGFDPSKLPPGVDPAALAAGQIPDGGLPPGVDPSKIGDAGATPPGALPPGFDPSKLPPGFDPSALPPGFDPSKLPPGVDPAALAAGGGLPPGVDPSKVSPGLAALPPDVRDQFVKAVRGRQKLESQIRRLNYIIDRNLTRDPADVVRLNRYVRAKREIDSRMAQMQKQHAIPDEVFRQMVAAAQEAEGSGAGAGEPQTP